MKSKTLSIFLCIVMATSVLAAMTQNVGPLSTGGIIYVDDDNTSGIEDGSLAHPYNTIQEGVDAASSGDTVYVFSGTYYEHVTVNKTLSLEGEDRNTTVIDGGGSGEVVLITTDWVNISGFTVSGSGNNAWDLRGGIRFENAQNCSISDNIISNNWGGIYLYYSSWNTVVDNKVSMNDGKGALYFHHSCDNTIANNNISNNAGGARLELSSNDNILTDNDFWSNGQSIYVTEDSSATITSNMINSGSIYVSHLSNVIMIGNEIRGILISLYNSVAAIVDNIITHGTWHGIQLTGGAYANITGNIISNYDKAIVISHASATITHNSISNSTRGIEIVAGSAVVTNNTIFNNSWDGINIYMSGATVVGNTISDNGCGIGAHGYSALVYHNNIIDNTQQAYSGTSANLWYHSTLLEGNYWSDYMGMDDGSGTGKHAIAGDWIGDTLIPHPGPDYDFYPFTVENGWKIPPASLPVANAGPDQTVSEGDVVYFNGSASYDPDGTIGTYEWDFDTNTDSDGDGIPTNDIDATGPTPTNVYGDNGVYTASLKVTDNEGVSSTDTLNITVLNLDPTVTIESTIMDLEIGLRVAGRKYNDIGISLYENGNPVAYLSIKRVPGSPDDQMAWIPMSFDMLKAYTATVTYTPEDPLNVGSNPVWIYIRLENGSIEEIHHTFNVQQSIIRDSEHWNHVEPWDVDINGNLIGHTLTFEGGGTDPGSDDLGFTWSFKATTTWFCNDGTIGTLPTDPYPSPWGTFPFSVTDIAFHTYTGPETITLTVEDDDGGTVSTSIELA